MHKRFLIFILFCLSFFTATAQELSLNRSITWDRGIVSEKSIYSPQENIYYLHFDKVVYYDPKTLFPYYYELIKIPDVTQKYKVELVNQQFTELDGNMTPKINFSSQLNSEIQVRSDVQFINKTPQLQVSFVPLRKNKLNGKIEKLVSFTLQVIPSSDKQYTNKTQKSAKNYVQTSVLNSGKWVKFKIASDGVYKITYSDIVKMGFSNPSAISLFGSGGKMLPEVAVGNAEDDLREIPTIKYLGTDNIFNEGDYLLVYLSGPISWKYDNNTGQFLHSLNFYSDYSYYYLTTDAGSSKNVKVENSVSGTPTNEVTTFNDYNFHELEKENILYSGRQWLGERFDMTSSYTFNFSFTNLVKSSPLKIHTVVAGASSVSSYFNIVESNNPVQTVPVSALSGDLSAVEATDNSSASMSKKTSDNVQLTLSYNNGGDASAVGWIDKFDVNVRRNMVFSGPFMFFRDAGSVGPGKISRFVLNNAGQTTEIFDISDIHNIKKVDAVYADGKLTFQLNTDSLHEFVALDNKGTFPSPFSSAEDVQPVMNQNLHGLSQPDLIVVTPSVFLDQANQLAGIHRNKDNLKVVVATTEQIYNEFSSGSPDIAALRNFVKMFYDRAGSVDLQPKYLLLYGDGSYDNKNNLKLSDNHNFIPTYQSENSFSESGTYTSDDYFGLLDDNEDMSTGLLDVGIGRIPVSSSSDTSMVGKINRYISSKTEGDWRNVVSFVADDEDAGLHAEQADLLSAEVKSANPDYNIQKIYLDAYQQVSSSVGQRYPQVNKAINEQVDKGTLIMNYTGHGGIYGWAQEQVLTDADIDSWTNSGKLPLFVTATCEFSKFDYLKETTAGERVLLQPNGGAIGLLTTTRVVYSGQNFTLNQNFYRYIFDHDSQGHKLRLGDIIRLTKNASGTDYNNRKFTLLGDPALELAYPANKVKIITDSLNGRIIGQNSDTLKALEKVRISGHIENQSGAFQNDYSGMLFPTVFDKSKSMTTLMNDDDSKKINFDLQNSVLYHGKASIHQGKFSFTFIIPKDIDYSYGKGKISYYAENSESDASGSYNNALVGGYSPSVVADSTGPDIRLYLNNEHFVFGGITDEHPVLLAKFSDKNGINTVGNGIGHDITCILDKNSSKSFVLNNYYESDTDSYQKGSIRYPLESLSEGNHNIKLKAWDTDNNSNEAYTEFVVSKSAKLVLNHVLNYPNPFTTHTSFYFEHNRPNTNLDVLIQVFTVSGKLVKTIETNINTDGFRAGPIDWDGLDDFGDKIGRGVYIFRVKLRSNMNETVEKFEKLVILR